MVTGIPMDTKVVIRSRYTDTQTHKDVYKRQGVINASCFLAISPSGPKYFFLSSAASFSFATIASSPVSYTHLDVYKRQVLK